MPHLEKEKAALSKLTSALPASISGEEITACFLLNCLYSVVCAETDATLNRDFPIRAINPL